MGPGLLEKAPGPLGHLPAQVFGLDYEKHALGEAGDAHGHGLVEERGYVQDDVAVLRLPLVEELGQGDLGRGGAQVGQVVDGPAVLITSLYLQSVEVLFRPAEVVFGCDLA
jgi:hypothetical protein